MEHMLYLVVGAIFGAIIGWFVKGHRSQAPDARIEGELRAQLGMKESELTEIRGKLEEAVAGRSGMEAQKNSIEAALVRERELQTQATVASGGKLASVQ